jgi:hypothetical protein
MVDQDGSNLSNFFEPRPLLHLEWVCFVFHVPLVRQMREVIVTQFERQQFTLLAHLTGDSSIRQGTPIICTNVAQR